MITKKEIKQVFRECGFRVTPTDMRGKAESFNFVKGDIRTDFSENSEWYKYRSGEEEFHNDEWTTNEYFHDTLIEIQSVMFSDLDDLKNLLTMKRSYVFGDAVSYFIHMRSKITNGYLLWVATTTSELFSWSGKQLPWANPEKLKKQMKDWGYHDNQTNKRRAKDQY